MSRVLEDQVAIVTGAGRGLGEDYAVRLAAEGMKVVGVDILASVHDVMARLGGTAVIADVSTLDGVLAVRDAALSAHGGIDVLVNNAGQWKQTPCDAGDRAQALADFHEIFDTNTKGPYMLARAVLASMIERSAGPHGGHIVNISTYYVLPPRPPESTGTNPPGTDLYGASKWALNGFTQAWALTLRPHGIRVNAMAMGATDAPMLRNLFKLRGIDPPPEVVAAWMTGEQQAQLLVDLLAEGRDGRSGETIGSWVGVPVELPPRRRTGQAIA